MQLSMKKLNTIILTLQNSITPYLGLRKIIAILKHSNEIEDKWISSKNDFIPHICSCCNHYTFKLKGGLFKIGNEQYVAPVCPKCLKKINALHVNTDMLVKL